MNILENKYNEKLFFFYNFVGYKACRNIRDISYKFYKFIIIVL